MKYLSPFIFLIGSAALTHAATMAYDFSGIRYAQAGAVSAGAFTYDSKADNNAASHSAIYTLTDDFDGDTIDDSFSFTLVATATSGIVNSNGSGYVGVGNPRLSNGEVLTYSMILPASPFVLSSGASGTAVFDGFTGGTVTNSVSYDYDVNGVNFTGTSFTAADTATMEIENVDTNNDDIFLPGISFGLSVTAVPEPSSSALLVIGCSAFFLRRRRS
ncbi:PEP-CTERM sorting domain-containing protein [Rubritalea sp.]|uniref:PEP-CTERM sorting domain-containing protein n=1 Tax=Rubritalea sp. TaxID=2109375 RepID=UPI003EFABD6D